MYISHIGLGHLKYMEAGRICINIILSKTDSGSFVPNPDYPPVQPNVATTITSVLSRVFLAYLDWLDVDAVHELYEPFLQGLVEKNDRLVQLHEAYISRL